MKDFSLLLMFSSDFRALLLKWHLIPFILLSFGARASYACCSLRENVLRRVFLEKAPAVAGWGALQRAGLPSGCAAVRRTSARTVRTPTRSTRPSVAGGLVSGFDPERPRRFLKPSNCMPTDPEKFRTPRKVNPTRRQRMKPKNKELKN
ncbi:hypothetical protein L484_023670 [Morus notabilis]|uniref:Uncharacterized protein n=1 Tax=Morus notabilis TaxID=981085 RepID=W9S2V2_9ROSA|nr:hypothetical protein L484_023670 [Morus notabilis]